MAKQKMSRLELFLMGKGPTARVVTQMRKAAEKSPGGKR